MSQVYATEPQTTGRVILETSHGPIDINLWCKECPTTTRMFLQLCLDGYYDSVVFHRIMENFLIQAGEEKFCGDGRRCGATQDVVTAEDRRRYLLEQQRSARREETSAVDGRQSSNRKLEVSPRIRFNHRGQVALALPLDEDVEGNANADALKTQFFITLDESPFLDGKHVIFGTVVGPTMFNALRIGKVAVENDTSRPIDMDMSPPMIKTVKIVHHPFHNLVPTEDFKTPWKQNRGKGSGGEAGEESEVKKRKKKRKGKRDLNVLSFGADMADDMDAGDGGGLVGMRSSHDVLARESPLLSSSSDRGMKEAVINDGEKPITKKIRNNSDGGIDDFATIQKTSKASSNLVEDAGNNLNVGKGGAKRLKSSQDNNAIVDDKEMKRSDRKKPERKERLAAKPDKAKNDRSSVEARRAKYLKGRSSPNAFAPKERSKREEDTMAKLFSFRRKVMQTKGRVCGGDAQESDKNGSIVDNSLAARMAKRSDAERQRDEDDSVVLAPTYHGQVLEDSGEEDRSAAWLQTQFKCRRHIDHMTKKGTVDEKQSGGDGRSINDYDVLDSKREKVVDDDDDTFQRHRDHRRRSGGSSGHRRQKHQSKRDRW